MPAERNQRAVLYGRCWRTGIGKTDLRQLRDDARSSDLGVLGELSLSFGDRGGDVRFGQVLASDRFSGSWTVPCTDSGLSSAGIRPTPIAPTPPPRHTASARSVM